MVVHQSDGARERMRRIADHLPTKAAKIRALGAEGFSRSEIAAFLGIRYQHVRNVLIHAANTTAVAGSEKIPPSEAQRFGRTRLDGDGRVVLPLEVFSYLGISVGGVVPWRVERDELILMSPTAGIRRARQIVAERVPSGGSSWVDELLAERRAEAKRESGDEQYG